jgi:GT2 family glycosyltransferase/tRNA A-37 threonylcarbamoyl transferase component Bud32
MVSIVIVTMGVDDLLKDCIASIHAHVACRYELILVNNSPYPLGMSGGIVIENGRNLGFARAVNRGIEAAHGERILLLNPDTRLTRDIVTPMVQFMDARPRAGICGLQLIFPDGSDQNSIDVIPNLANQLMNKALLKIFFSQAYPSKRSGFQEPVQVPTVIGACMLLRREMLAAIGLLDEGFFFYLEETDLCKRALEHGYEVWHLPTLRLIHYQGTTARKSDVRRKIEYNRSMQRFFRKHKDLPQTVLLYACSILKAGIELAVNLPLAFLPKVRVRLLRTGGVLFWHIAGMPSGCGLEDSAPRYEITRRDGRRWFLPAGADLPKLDPQVIMDGFTEILNTSRTTYVKKGTLGERAIYMKRYNYKGVGDTLKNLFRKSRALKAFEASLVLEALGVDTPRVLFACEKRTCGFLLDSFFATEAIAARDLVRYAHEQGAKREDIIGLAKLIRRLHEMGVMHVDMKGENLLIDEHKRIYLIDLDRLKKCRFLGLRKIAKNLSYLYASFAPLIEMEDRKAFLAEYIKGNSYLVERRERLVAKTRAYTGRRLKTRS